MKKEIVKILRDRNLVNVEVKVTDMGYAVKANIPIRAELRGCKSTSLYHKEVAKAMDTIDFNIEGFVTEEVFINKDNDYEFFLIPSEKKTIEKYRLSLIRAGCVENTPEALGVLLYMINRISDEKKKEEADSILMKMIMS